MILEKEKTIKYRIDKKTFLLQFLPQRLEYISKTTTINHDNQSIKSSYIIDIVHNLILKTYLKKENIFSLSSLILREKYGKYYNYYMDFLIQKNILILIKEYFNGKNARIYKLNDNIFKEKINRYKNTDKIILKKYKTAVSFIEKTDISKNLIHPEIKKRLVSDLFSVKVEFEKAIFFLDETEQDDDTYNRNKYSVECINDTHIFYHFDSYGRMHTNFTILKSFIRKNCLKIDNLNTIELDISNSQPLFLYNIIKNTPNNIDKYEFDLFKYLVINGKLYDFINDNSPFETKKEAKQLTYRVLFGRNYNTKEDSYFKMMFPTIYQFIKNWKKEKGDYRFLSYELQRLESDFIFNKVIKKLYSLDDEIKIITVHDSIIVNTKYKDIANIIFNKNISELYS